VALVVDTGEETAEPIAEGELPPLAEDGLPSDDGDAA
jgi:hypothetical protein